MREFMSSSSFELTLIIAVGPIGLAEDFENAAKMKRKDPKNQKMSFSFHRNKRMVCLHNYGAVVDLMGEGTSVHDNEGDGMFAEDRGATFNVYQPCVLNDMSHGNKGQNIRRAFGGSSTVQQKDSKK